MSRPVTTVVPSANAPCWFSESHIWVALVPAHATNSRSGWVSAACLAKVTRSVAGSAGTRTGVTVAPSPPSTAVTAATFAWPKALSWAKTVIFLPCRSPTNEAAVSMSW